MAWFWSARSTWPGLFIGLELLSVPVYGLVAYAFFNKRSLEAGIKYMVLSAAGSAFLLFGMALLYADSGSLSFVGIGQALAATGLPSSLAQLGLGMMLIGLAFKLSLVPFHLWTRTFTKVLQRRSQRSWQPLPRSPCLP